MAQYRSDWIRRHPLIGYFVLAFGISWVLISPLVFSALGLLSFNISPHWHFLGALGPLLAAVITTRGTAGKAGLAAFARALGRWRVGFVWLSVAVFSPILLFVVAALIVRAVGNPWPDFSKLSSTEYGNFEWVFGSLLSALAYGIGEEAGWRGFALPRLQKNHTALMATLILSICWALWHIPMFFYRFEFGVGQIIGFFIGLCAGAIWLTFLYNSTGGSVFIVATWHAIWNSVNIIGLVVSAELVSVMSAIIMVSAVVIIIVWRPARLSVAHKHISPSSAPLPVPCWYGANEIHCPAISRRH